MEHSKGSVSWKWLQGPEYEVKLVALREEVAAGSEQIHTGVPEVRIARQHVEILLSEGGGRSHADDALNLGGQDDQVAVLVEIGSVVPRRGNDDDALIAGEGYSPS